MNQSVTNLTPDRPMLAHGERAPTDVTTTAPPEGRRSAGWRETLREQALSNAMRKRAVGVPSYSVPEAAALLSLSQEYLYRLIQSEGFPAVRMRSGNGQGRYVIPAKAVEQLLDAAAATGSCVESADFTKQWRAGTTRGSK
jgi:excisionase family DNA binding protein